MKLSRDELEHFARQFWTAKREGRSKIIEDMISPDIVWNIVGKNAKLARSYVGAKEYLEDLVGILAKEFLPTGRRLDITAVYADPEHQTAIVCLDEKAATKSGKTFHAQIVQIMRISSDHKLLRCDEYIDLAEVLRTFENQAVNQP